MNPKEMVLQDLPDLYPGLTRSGVEMVLQVLDEAQSTTPHGQSVASNLATVVPSISSRLATLTGSELTDYLRVLRSATVLVLQMWQADRGHPPRYASVATAVRAIEG